MQVFISWSGDRSKHVALALRDWLPSVLQSIEPYVSSEDIEKGARWSTDIAQRLDGSSFGILCVTRDNAGAPWLNFEAGALAKSVDTARVAPFLVDLTAADLVGPLSQFQVTLPTFADVLRLVRSINGSTERPVDDVRLAATVELWWPKLDAALQSVPPGDTYTDDVARPEADVLNEVLELARNTQHRLARLEKDAAVTRAPASREEIFSVPPALLHDRLLQSLGVELPPGLSFDVSSHGQVTFHLKEPISPAWERRIRAVARNAGATDVEFFHKVPDRREP